MPDTSFHCSSCGLEHSSFPFSFAAEFPDRYANLNAEARDLRALIGSDQCIIDQSEFYIRGCLEIPIIGNDEIFMWGLWARMHEADFDEISEHWETAGRENIIGPYKGRLANSLSIYPETLNQKVEIRISPVGARPVFILQEPGSLLYDEQRLGLSTEKASEYSCLLMRMANG